MVVSGVVAKVVNRHTGIDRPLLDQKLPHTSTFERDAGFGIMTRVGMVNSDADQALFVGHLIGRNVVLRHAAI